jgi:hypothetical protein
MRPDIGYGSHFPVLAAAILKTTGPVLELGCGWTSTPMLRLLCRPNRTLESYDNSKEWAEQFNVPVVENWSKWEPLQQHYGVAFIDSHPGEERRHLAMKLKGRADFLVLHDHEAGPAAAYYYEHIIGQFKYAETYRMLRPHTLILSDKEPFGLTWEEMAVIP